MKRDTQAPADVVAGVRMRDHDRCARCGVIVAHRRRGIDWSLHHRRPRGMGGTRNPGIHSPANLVILCGSGTTDCHGWVESNRTAATLEGFLISHLSTDDPAAVAIEHRVHGYVRLDDNFQWDEAA